MSTPPPPVSPEPPDLAPRKPGSDSVMTGCLTGCAVQIGFFGLSALITFVFDSQLARMGLAKYDYIIFMSWGLTQWIGIIPMILSNRTRGRSKTAQGLIIVGCIGVLLSSACASMLSNLGNMH